MIGVIPFFFNIFSANPMKIPKMKDVLVPLSMDLP